MKSSPKACGNWSCDISTGIHDGLTFGRGELDEHGFWQTPCAPCARAYEKNYPESAPCWPFESYARPHNWIEAPGDESGISVCSKCARYDKDVNPMDPCKG